MEINIIAILVFAYLGLILDLTLTILAKQINYRCNTAFWFHCVIVGALYPLT
jgi:hypothetical protein